MAEYGLQDTVALKANADLSAHQFHVVALVGENLCNLATSANSSLICGVLQNKPQSQEAATVARGGGSKVQVGAAVTAGDHLTTNSSARAIKVTSGAMAFGQALATAGADGDIISAQLYSPVRWGAVA